jgi:hypothetical protein
VAEKLERGLKHEHVDRDSRQSVKFNKEIQAQRALIRKGENETGMCFIVRWMRANKMTRATQYCLCGDNTILS